MKEGRKVAGRWDAGVPVTGNPEPALGGSRSSVLGVSCENGDVRKQYHFWPGVEGLDAWDVDRLIDLSASHVEEDVSVAAISEVDTACGDPRDASMTQVLEGMVDAMTKSRSERAAALDAWAGSVAPEDLRSADTDALRLIAELAQQREQLDAELAESVRAARAARKSWSEIGAMLGVSKQAAQRKYRAKASA